MLCFLKQAHGLASFVPIYSDLSDLHRPIEHSTVQNIGMFIIKWSNYFHYVQHTPNMDFGMRKHTNQLPFSMASA